MADNPRQTGALSNKRGNRYEDFFVVYRLIQQRRASSTKAPWFD